MVLLVNLGTPDEPTETAIRRYLKEFLGDPRVVSVPRLLWWFVLRLSILPRRPRELVSGYRAIWGDDSPIRSISYNLVKRLRLELAKICDNTLVECAMTYGAPSLPDVLAGVMDDAPVTDDSPQRLLVIPLYPQYSTTTTAAVFDKIHQLMKRTTNTPELLFINSYYDHSKYIKAIATSISQHEKVHGQSQKLLLSFHGLPLSRSKEDSYASQCQHTAELIASELSLDRRQWMLTYQSRRGNQRWLAPYTDDTLRQLPTEGINSVSVVCPGFAADCLETLQEIDVEAREVFLKAGGVVFHYIPALNAGNGQTELMLELIREQLDATST